MPTPPDRFDEIRRKWIARYQHGFTFQKRRQEVLARQIRDRAWEKTGARVDPADDDVIHSLFRRGHTTVYALQDLAIIGVLAIAAPMGWPLGKALYHSVIQLIPEELRSYPITAFMWAAVAVGLPCRCSTAQATRGQRPWSFPGSSRRFPRHFWQPASTASWKAGWPSTGRVTGGPCVHRRTTTSSTSVCIPTT